MKWNVKNDESRCLCMPDKYGNPVYMVQPSFSIETDTELKVNDIRKIEAAMVKASAVEMIRINNESGEEC